MSEADHPVGRVLGEFRDYGQMLAGIRARVNEMQVNGERFDEFAGLPRGYLSKIAGTKPVRRIGITSMGPLLSALGVTCIFVEDPEATARLKNRLKPRNPRLVRSAASEFRLSHRWLRKIASKGGTARDAKLTPEQRSELARELNRIRWKKPRVTEIKHKARAA
jgi:hypothetical protein